LADANGGTIPATTLNGTVVVQSESDVPEPASGWLVMVCLVGFGARLCRRTP
jgi:hypothetical protein